MTLWRLTLAVLQQWLPLSVYHFRHVFAVLIKDVDADDHVLVGARRLRNRNSAELGRFILSERYSGIAQQLGEAKEL